MPPQGKLGLLPILITVTCKRRRGVGGWAGLGLYCDSMLYEVLGALFDLEDLAVYLA
jgi:hypothetical protein